MEKGRTKNDKYVMSAIDAPPLFQNEYNNALKTLTSKMIKTNEDGSTTVKAPVQEFMKRISLAVQNFSSYTNDHENVWNKINMRIQQPGKKVG